jgi:hypothetical protein
LVKITDDNLYPQILQRLGFRLVMYEGAHVNAGASQRRDQP